MAETVCRTRMSTAACRAVFSVIYFQAIDQGHLFLTGGWTQMTLGPLSALQFCGSIILFLSSLETMLGASLL